MAFYNHRALFSGEEPPFAPLIRLLDDWDSYSNGRNGHLRRHQQVVFKPRFDVRETKDAYHLHGELPGIEKKNVEINFKEPQTMTISGRVERTYSRGTPPSSSANNLVEDAPAAKDNDTEMSGALSTEAPATPTTETAAHSHQATVSDEETEAAKEKGEASTTVAPAASSEKKAVAPTAPKERFWQQERSIGEFHRTFTFPERVDEDAVTAHLENGILTITVPKAAKHAARRVAIN